MLLAENSIMSKALPDLAESFPIRRINAVTTVKSSLAEAAGTRRESVRKQVVLIHQSRSIISFETLNESCLLFLLRRVEPLGPS